MFLIKWKKRLTIKGGWNHDERQGGNLHRSEGRIGKWERKRKPKGTKGTSWLVSFGGKKQLYH